MITKRQFIYTKEVGKYIIEFIYTLDKKKYSTFIIHIQD